MYVLNVPSGEVAQRTTSRFVLNGGEKQTALQQDVILLVEMGTRREDRSDIIGKNGNAEGRILIGNKSTRVETPLAARRPGGFSLARSGRGGAPRLDGKGREEVYGRSAV